MVNLIFLFGLSFVLLASSNKIDPWEVRCHVCKATIIEMENEISKMDPNKIIEVSGFRLDAGGNSISKTVKYSKSETYLTELMEKICSKMEDYAKATNKKTGKLSIIKMIVAGGMNPDIGLYDFVQDGDLNKSLEHYCLEILEDHEETFLQTFMNNNIESDIDIKICSEKAKYCSERPIQEEYKLEDEL